MKKISLITLLIFTIALVSCSKDEQKSTPKLSTLDITNITLSTAISGGNITSDGGDPITSRGIVWSTSHNPTIALTTKTTDGSNFSTFISNLSNLTPNTTYYVRAYATNNKGTSYGNEISFTTNVIQLPTLSSSSVSSITHNSATSGGLITNDGGGQITTRGIVWSISQNPTIALATKTTDGTGTGTFTSNLVNLNPNTTYYLRAYATNSTGTGYGNELIFTTQQLLTLTTTAISAITNNSVISGGNITSDGGQSITARGIVWSTSSAPTTALNTKTIDGTGMGSFTSSITGLSATTTYYLRAYATNSSGTTYGNEISFSTSNPTNSIAIDIDQNQYQMVTICNQVWSKENLNVSKYRNGDIIPQVTDPTQWSNLKTGAWCYYNNDSANGAIYGKLYNWYAVNDPRGLAPSGYHIPSFTEWVTLSTCLGGDSIAGGAMKETGTNHWASPNSAATNSSNFTGLPGGNRAYTTIVDVTSFVNIYKFGYWWSSSEKNTTEAPIVLLYYNNGAFQCDPNYTLTKDRGISVRFIKD